MEWSPDDDKVTCLCSNLTELTFGNSFFVTPNSIDFSSVFLKFSPLNQAAVMGAIIGIFIIYIIAVVTVMGLDRQDVVKVWYRTFSLIYARTRLWAFMLRICHWNNSHLWIISIYIIVNSTSPKYFKSVFLYVEYLFYFIFYHMTLLVFNLIYLYSIPL